MMNDRAERQIQSAEWCERCFGRDHLMDKEIRIKRFMEEALELAQACGLTAFDISMITAHVFSKEPGQIGQEMGGVGNTLLVLAHAHGMNADWEEEKELKRVLSLPVEHFQKRNKAKDY